MADDACQVGQSVSEAKTTTGPTVHYWYSTYGVSKFDMSEASKQRAASHHHVILNSDASGPTGTIYDGLKSHNWDVR
jgi:hypothetical protein